MYDLSKEKVLYCVGYAHLDTQWRWDYPTTIDRYVRDTLEQNFALFEKYPGYVFNFTGSVRYRMMKEYYPQAYERLKGYVAAGRWHVSGSSVDEGDVNVPSAEATIRQVLYGNAFFREEFGKESADFMLPDCFGFPASMPSIWAHCGLLGFSTQKLTWGSAVGIPFKIGVWEGLDGKSVIAALDPGSYGGAIEGRVDLNEVWINRVMTNGRNYGVWADYSYYGVGDQGGAPRDEDVANYLASIDNPDGKIKVALVSSDQMYKDITSEQRARLPRYRGDMLLTEHSAGTLTSQSYMKRWNRKNEILADAAERAAVIADWLGAAAYPIDKLNRSWERVLANQMHDILPGTSIPRAYTYSWNDEIVAMNGFAAVLLDSVGGVASAMDTRVEGVPLVVFNPLAVARTDVVEATVEFSGGAPNAVRVFDGNGQELPSQVLKRENNAIRLLFQLRADPVSLTVCDVRASDTMYSETGGPTVTESTLENDRYRVVLNDAGDVEQITDKKAGRPLLAEPARLVFTHEKPENWPAWNMDWADRQHPPVDYVKGPARIRIVESGPVRVAIEVERKARNSIVSQRISLARGDAGQRIEFASDVDWQSTECALKASFPLAVSNPNATYNWGMGTIERGNNEPVKYEVPSHEWFDLTDTSGEYGVSVLDDSKYGSDKPSDNTVRLTLLYTPGVRHSFLDQHSQDWGRHEFIYGIYGHDGDWRAGRSEWQGRRLNQPLLPFQVRAHEGVLGKSFRFASVSTEQVDIRALKRAESSDRIVVRLQELWGKNADGVVIAFHRPIADAYEVDGQERRIGDAVVKNGKLAVDMTAFSPRSFAIQLAVADAKSNGPECTPVALAYDSDLATTDGDRTNGGFDDSGRSLPAEMLPREIVSEGVRFRLADVTGDDNNAIACAGQQISLPQGEFNRLYVLAAATEDTQGRFRIDDKPVKVNVQSWTGFLGQWDDRVWDREFAEVDYHCDGKVLSIKPGFIKRDTVAWFCTHRHHPKHGNEAYRFSYLFKYCLDLPRGAKTLTLPDNAKIKVCAVTAASNENDAIRAAAPLYDDYSNRKAVELRHVYPPPPAPVFEGADAVGAVLMDRQESFDALSMGAPVETDIADRSAGVVFRYYEHDGAYRPHPRAGAVAGTLPRLNDGEVARNNDDIERCVWYDGDGCFYVDLGRSVPLSRINVYSHHRSNRALQHFSVWGSDEATMPSPNIAAGKHDGWTLLGVVDTKSLGEGAVHGSSVSGGDKPLGPFRYLLWVEQDVGQGTFFTEIDVHATE